MNKTTNGNTTQTNLGCIINIIAADGKPDVLVYQCGTDEELKPSATTIENVKAWLQSLDEATKPDFEVFDENSAVDFLVSMIVGCMKEEPNEKVNELIGPSVVDVCSVLETKYWTTIVDMRATESAPEGTITTMEMSQSNFEFTCKYIEHEADSGVLNRAA